MKRISASETAKVDATWALGNEMAWMLPCLRIQRLKMRALPVCARAGSTSGQVARRVCGDKRCDRVTEIGCHQDDQPEARDVITLAGSVEGKQPERHQRVAK